MAYSLDFRELAVYLVREEGKTHLSVTKLLHIGISSLKRWLKREELKASKTGPKGAYKVNREALKELVKEKPDAYLDEYAENLGAKRSSIAYNLSVLGLSRKKKQALQRARRKKARTI